MWLQGDLMKTRKHHILSVSTIFAVVLAFSSWAQALTVCLNARSTDDPASGHSFVTVYSGAKIVETYGFWPTSKHAGSIAINKRGDFPVQYLLAQGAVVLAEGAKLMAEDKICSAAPGVSLSDMRSIVNSYMGVYGRYRALSNNCNHFAVRIFNAITDQEFPVKMTPLATRKLIAQITR